MHFEPINIGVPRFRQGKPSGCASWRTTAVRLQKYFAMGALSSRYSSSNTDWQTAESHSRGTREYRHNGELAAAYPHLASRNDKALSRFSILAAALVLLALGSACGGRRTSARVPVARIGATQEGIASWYGEPYHGRRAANGEIFDMAQPTAAHPSLPFETWVRVRHLANKRTTEVRITDRGPFVKGRIIDLSRAAAQDIDLLGAGTAKVRLTVIPPPKSYLRGRQFTVQVSSAPVKERAELLQRQLSAQYNPVFIRYRSPNPAGGHAEAWRILVGRENSPADAQRILAGLQSKFPNAFIVPWDAE